MKRTDRRCVEQSVADDGRFFLIPVPAWNRFSADLEDLVAIHDCKHTSESPFYVAWRIDEPCIRCGKIASDKIQTLYALHNGHY